MTIGLFIEDIQYSYRIADFFKKDNMSVVIFTNYKQVCEYRNKLEVHVLIIDEENIQYSYLDYQNLIVFAEEKDIKQISGLYAVYKYQSVGNIIKDVCNYIADNISTDNTNVERDCNNKKILTIFSPVSRCGKSILSMVLGVKLSKKSRTLLINLEDYSAMQVYIGEKRDFDNKDTEIRFNISDIIYYYMNQNKNFVMKLNATIGNFMNLDYILPVRYSNELYDIDEKIWEVFLLDILKLTSIEYIVIDLSMGVRGYDKLLNISNAIYMPYNDDRISVEKVNAFCSSMNYESINKKIHKIVIPKADLGSKENIIKSNIDNKFGEYVDKIIYDLKY